MRYVVSLNNVPHGVLFCCCAVFTVGDVVENSFCIARESTSVKYLRALVAIDVWQEPTFVCVLHFVPYNSCTIELFADILASKKKAYAELARVINCTKEEMDKSLTRLNLMKAEREAEGKWHQLERDV